MMVSSILTGVENDELSEDFSFSMPFSNLPTVHYFNLNSNLLKDIAGNNFTTSHSQQPEGTSRKLPPQNGVAGTFNRNMQLNNEKLLKVGNKSFNAERIGNVSGLEIHDSSSLSSGGFLGLNDTKALANQQTSSLTSNGWQVQSRESVNNNPSAPFESAHSFNESSAYEKSLSGNGNSWN